MILLHLQRYRRQEIRGSWLRLVCCFIPGQHQRFDGGRGAETVMSSWDSEVLKVCTAEGLRATQFLSSSNSCAALPVWFCFDHGFSERLGRAVSRSAHEGLSALRSE